MTMNLKLVTWNNDTQFLVDANTDTEAIDKAIESHQEYDATYGPYDKRDENDIQLADILDRHNYEVENVGIITLFNLIRRTDWCDIYKDAIIFD